MSNIEAAARYACSMQMSRSGLSGEELAAYVDRYWHCVAGDLEAGHIDEAGNQVTPFDLEKGLEAYRDWRRRHPQNAAR